MKNTILVGLLAASLALVAMAPSARADDAAPTVCKDGTTSQATGKGACSGHGGVQKKSKASAAPAASEAPAASSGSSSSGAGPTTCKDGTTSQATGKGACSGHGGVQKKSK